MFRRLVAPGIEIRALTPADAVDVYAVVDADREHLRPWLPWVDRTQSPADIAAFADSVAAAIETGEELHAIIRVEGVVAGAIGYHRIDAPNRTCSLGYWIAYAYQGRGIVTACCRSLIDYLIEERGLHRVEIRCGTANHRSAAVPQRLGFRREGVLRDAEWVNDRWLDLIVWGMLEHEWRRLRPA